ncbi:MULTISPECIES: hypothetical protein [unclassified Lysobacter]
MMICAGTVLALAGCAATPSNNAAVLEIGDEEIQNYWIPTSEIVSTRLEMADVRVRARSGAPRAMAHTVEVTYVIGADGKVRGARVVSTEPASANGQWAVAGVSASSYEPAPGNSARVPVRMTHTMTMTLLDAPPATH